MCNLFSLSSFYVLYPTDTRVYRLSILDYPLDFLYRLLLNYSFMWFQHHSQVLLKFTMTIVWRVKFQFIQDTVYSYSKIHWIVKHTCTYAPAAAVGHACVLQSPKLLESPEQGNPPFWGKGSEQVLEREYLPPPHVTEQAPHVPQADHDPSTVKVTDKTQSELANHHQTNFKFKNFKLIV